MRERRRRKPKMDTISVEHWMGQLGMHRDDLQMSIGYANEEKRRSAMLKHINDLQRLKLEVNMK